MPTFLMQAEGMLQGIEKPAVLLVLAGQDSLQHTVTGAVGLCQPAIDDMGWKHTEDGAEQRVCLKVLESAAHVPAW